MKNLIKILFATLSLFPAIAFAQLTKTQGLLQRIGTVIDILIVIAAGAALLVFFWGLVRFIFKIGGDGKAEDGRKLMIWGVVALFVMVSVWGIVRFIAGELGVTDNAPIQIPKFTY